MIRALLLLAWLGLGPSLAQAAATCPRNGDGWTAACFTGTGSERRVKPRYLARLDWNRYGMATIIVDQPRELLAVDRRGKVAVPDIRHTGDFDYPDAEHGIGRFTARSATGRRQCGYFAAERFTVVVAPVYDQCEAFHDGEAAACQDCVRYCRDEDCHDSVLVGGRGVVLAPDGKVLRSFTPATMDNVCGRDQASVRRPGATAVLTCPPAADSPFALPPADPAADS
ncbi:hypothetical protein IP91_04252 [Pseudoduganella lurida]|uniref:WG repeat-containing protein n=1 Tax=Pseudoduganella lurida TaxID=1036180 RepID=A0A562QZY4_9BURK|nr:hypothetical protein [Pseudoduganella lurida]TWI62143.1 hypothetical protein IP91_04252 [Pseudoduganella lurida]